MPRQRCLPPKSVSVRKSGRGDRHWSITIPERLKGELGWKRGKYQVTTLFWVDVGLSKGALVISELNETMWSEIEDLKKNIEILELKLL